MLTIDWNDFSICALGFFQHQFAGNDQCFFIGKSQVFTSFESREGWEVECVCECSRDVM